MAEPVPTVLIIDNDEGMVAAIQIRLESMGYRCVTAATGAQGIAAFREQNIDVVITDLNMPTGDGITVARTLRAMSGVPIIVVTGFHDEYQRELRATPNITLMEKPFDFDHLLDLLETDLVMNGCRLP